MPVPYRPITRVQKVVESTGLSITYAFEDLVFIDQNAFLVQMKEKNDQIAIYFNVESDEKLRPEIMAKLVEAGREQELVIACEGTFTLKDSDDEQIQIEFFP